MIEPTTIGLYSILDKPEADLTVVLAQLQPVAKICFNPERKEMVDKANLILDALNVYHETQLTPRELADQRAELLAALRRLAGNAGALAAFEDGIRECAGNTNWQCLIEAIHAADDIIAKCKSGAA